MMKMPTIPTMERAESVTEWAAPLESAQPTVSPVAQDTQPEPAAVLTSDQAKEIDILGSDVLGSAKMLGMEFWNHVMLKIVFSMFVARMLVPLAIVLSNDLSGIDFWAGVIAVLLAPFCYAFFIAMSGKPNLLLRLSIQWVLFAIGFLLVALLGMRTVTESLMLIAATGGLLAVAALIGCQFISSKKTEPKDSSVGKASLAGFAKETAPNILGIGLGLFLCIGSHYVAAQLESQVQVVRFVGKPAPELNCVSPDDEEWTLGSQTGKVVVVEYWSPHCLPCIVAIESLEKIQSKYGQREDFELVSVSLGSKEQSIEIHDTIDDPWKLVFPAKSEELGFNPKQIPMAYIIDRDGSVYAAGVAAGQLETKLSELFETNNDN